MIKKYGKEAYDLMRKQSREWHYKHTDRVKVFNHETNRKGGRYYEKALAHANAGLPRERKAVRGRHQHQFRRLKRFFAQESEIHHQWTPGTAEYTGVALVEKDQHMHGIIDVIYVLDGEITLLTEDRYTLTGAKE